ncbi:ImmA/IrrE family metallo-endopeptidase [Microbacterium testaceum]|uniref:ImmA/IrrE family metallo-endopeptidase n=1 Tax=Microbacterium testaceum TaxID=2033 RepID=UPI00128EC702
MRSSSRGRAYDPWAHADELGIDVFVRPLRTAHGLWLPEHNAILVHSRLRANSQRLILAHELGHAALAHPDDRPKHEVQADRFAANNLIHPAELEELYGWCSDERQIIQELGVTTRLFRAYVLGSAA